MLPNCDNSAASVAAEIGAQGSLRLLRLRPLPGCRL
jgi:hypothetical protein